MDRENGGYESMDGKLSTPYPSGDYELVMCMEQNLDDECTIQREPYSYPKMAPSLDDKGHNIGYNIVEI
jgi:hypothetical protein